MQRHQGDVGGRMGRRGKEQGKGREQGLGGQRCRRGAAQHPPPRWRPTPSTPTRTTRFTPRHTHMHSRHAVVFFNAPSSHTHAFTTCSCLLQRPLFPHTRIHNMQLSSSTPPPPCGESLWRCAGGWPQTPSAATAPRTARVSGREAGGGRGVVGAVTPQRRPPHPVPPRPSPPPHTPTPTHAHAHKQSTQSPCTPNCQPGPSSIQITSSSRPWICATFRWVLQRERMRGRGRLRMWVFDSYPPTLLPLLRAPAPPHPPKPTHHLLSPPPHPPHPLRSSPRCWPSRWPWTITHPTLSARWRPFAR